MLTKLLGYLVVSPVLNEAASTEKIIKSFVS
jgi:hypothetical protein